MKGQADGFQLKSRGLFGFVPPREGRNKKSHQKGKEGVTPKAALLDDFLSKKCLY